MFGEKDLRKLDNILKFLDVRGLVKDCQIAGDAMGYITTEGAMWVEEGGDTGIISRYKASPEGFVIDQSTKIYGNVHGGQVASHSHTTTQHIGSSAEALALASQIVDRLTSDAASAEEVVADAKLLEQELKRREPRRRLLQSLLSTLADISSISSLVSQLSRLLGI